MEGRPRTFRRSNEYMVLDKRLGIILTAAEQKLGSFYP